MHIVPRVQLLAVTPKRTARNQGWISVQKRLLLPKQVWAICSRLERARYLPNLALFKLAIDSKLRGCDLVKVAATDLFKDDPFRVRVPMIQIKTKKPNQI